MKCIAKDANFETLACYDKAERELSRLTGKKKKLASWIKSKKCQIKDKCTSIEKVQSKNKNVQLKCVSDNGKVKTMSCSDGNGNILSTKTGKIKELVKWVKSIACSTNDVSRNRLKGY